jgi:hypothetical protein
MILFWLFYQIDTGCAFAMMLRLRSATTSLINLYKTKIEIVMARYEAIC